MSYSIKFDNPNFLRVMSSEMQRAVPKAINDALNEVAFDAMRELKRTIPSEVHTTNNFIKNSIAVSKATGSKFQSEVGIMKRVYFADLLVEGGERHSINSKYVAVPIGAKGANGRAKKSRKPKDILLKNKEYFVKTINGTKGIWGVWKGHISLMYLLVPKTEYNEEPYINWEDDVRKAVQNSDFEKIFMKRLSKVLLRS